MSIVDNQVFDGKSSPTKKDEIEDNVGMFTFVHIFTLHSNKSSDLSHRIGVTIHLSQEKCKYHHTFQNVKPLCWEQVALESRFSFQIEYCL